MLNAVNHSELSDGRNIWSKCKILAQILGFPKGVENMGGGVLQNLKGRGEKNTCEGIHLIVKLSTISLQACKFTKNELLHKYFSRI